MDIFDVYAAVVAANVTTLVACALVFKGRNEFRTRYAHAVAGVAAFSLVGVPLLYFLFRVS